MNNNELKIEIISTPPVFGNEPPFVMPKIKAVEADPKLDDYIDPTPFILDEDDEDLDDSPRQRSEWTAPSELSYLS